MPAVRPYRSHRFPACTRCRQRRTRCTIDKSGNACILCRVSEVRCSAERCDNNGSAAVASSLVADRVEAVSDSRIVGPVVARDTDVLNTLVPGIEKSALSAPLTSTAYDYTPRQPIYHVDILSRRPSPPGCVCTIQSFSKLIAQVQPILEELIDVYFRKLYVCFPLLGETSLRGLFSRPESTASTLFLNFVAYTAFYWSRTSGNSRTRAINLDHSWQVAVTALDRESQRADAFSLASLILNIVGRPSKAVVHNTGNIARATAFAQSIGLNHDCTGWNLTQVEKNTRCKIWWAVLIHDRWFNFAHGTPPAIGQSHYDVQIPTPSTVVGGHTTDDYQLRALECYIQLCKLTEIVGIILPLLHSVRSHEDGGITSTTKRAESSLDQWTFGLPTWLDLNSLENRIPVPGLPNLQLSYLAVSMLLKRLAWHENAQHFKDEIPSLLLDCLQAADHITKFTQSLTQDELMGFWLPYNAQHFTSAVILLLRCAVQAKTSDTQARALKSARQLVDSLTYYDKSLHWDMADIVLEHCRRIYDKVEAALQIRSLHLNDTTPSSATIRSNTVVGEDRIPIEWAARGTEDATLDFTFGESIENLFPELFNGIGAGNFLDLECN